MTKKYTYQTLKKVLSLCFDGSFLSSDSGSGFPPKLSLIQSVINLKILYFKKF